MSSEMILVTGASGHTAIHVIKQLLQEGHRVRGTVRSLGNEIKIKPLKDLCPDAKYPLELVEADLLEADSWKSVVEGCPYVMHIASPMPEKIPKDGTKVIQMEIDGTLNVLNACKEAKTVKRVVVTSSMAAVDANKGDEASTEEDWLDCTRKDVPFFYKNKTLAERAAWDFVDSLEGDEKFELAVINPGFAMGPVLCGVLSEGMAMPKLMLEGDMPMLPRFNVGVIDVRDMAAAHIKAMFVPEAAGHRFICTGGNMWFKEIAETIREEFNPQGYNVKTTIAPYWLLWVIARFSSSIRLMLPLVGKVSKGDNTKLKTILGIEPRNIKHAITDMLYSLIENGRAKKTTGYTGPNYKSTF